MENKPYTHILQKKGILKAFSVAKVVRKKDIEELKQIIKSMTKSEDEYNQMLNEEMAKMSDMHDQNNPIPGIIYSTDETTVRRAAIYEVARKISDGIKKKNIEKADMALLISAIISNLELTQEDFINLNEDLKNELDEEDEDGFDDEF